MVKNISTDITALNGNDLKNKMAPLASVSRDIGDFEDDNDENTFPLSSIMVQDKINISLISKPSKTSYLHTPHFATSSQEFKIECANGFTMQVTVQGDRNKPAILTYHDIGLNHISQFQNFFDYDEMAIICKRFCVYHIDAPGQEENALPLDESSRSGSPSAMSTPPSSSNNGDSTRLVSNKSISKQGGSKSGKFSAPPSIDVDTVTEDGGNEDREVGEDNDKIGFTTNLPKISSISGGVGSKTSFRGSMSRNSRSIEMGKSPSFLNSPVGSTGFTGFITNIWHSFNLNQNYPTMDGLAEMITDIIKFFNLKSFVGLGVGAGANILSRYALRHADRVEALFLIEATGSPAGWTEWGYQKMNSFYLRRNSNSLTNFTHDYLIWHHFGRVTPDKNADLVTAFRDYFSRHINNSNLASFLESYIKRGDLGISRSLSLDTVSMAATSAPTPKGSKNFNFPVMLVVGSESPHVEESEALYANLEPSESSWLKVSGCGGMVLEERPEKVAEAFRLFLQGLGYIPYLTQSLMNSSGASGEGRRTDFQKYRSLSTNAYSPLYPEILKVPLRDDLFNRSYSMAEAEPRKTISADLKPSTAVGATNSIKDGSTNQQKGKNYNGKKILKVIDIPPDSVKSFAPNSTTTDIPYQRQNHGQKQPQVTLPTFDACSEQQNGFQHNGNYSPSVPDETTTTILPKDHLLSADETKNKMESSNHILHSQSSDAYA